MNTDSISYDKTRRHTFFCTNKERHLQNLKIVDIHKKEITVFGKVVHGWLITTEEEVIENFIPIKDTMYFNDRYGKDPE